MKIDAELPAVKDLEPKPIPKLHVRTRKTSQNKLADQLFNAATNSNESPGL